jgi:hypothetical protein
MNSKKELILARIETVILGIKKGLTPSPSVLYTYENTVALCDRQYINPSVDEIQNKAMPWVLVNNEGEELTPFPGAHFESTMLLQLVGFVKCTSIADKLDTKMNSLQRDILVAMLSDTSLAGLCSYLVPRSVMTVQELIHPYGGFVLNMDVIYNFSGTNL